MTHTNLLSNHSPTILLVRPQMGENIGSAARSMLNFGLTSLSLVAPRDGWPNPKAEDMAKHALPVIEQAKVYPTTEAALAEYHYVLATTARSRDIIKPVLSVKEAAESIHAHAGNVAILFGPEQSGLSNQELALTDALIHISVSDQYPSLNLAQAVTVIAYELYHHATKPVAQLNSPKIALASKNDIHCFLEHLSNVLKEARFFHPTIKKKMIQNMHAMVLRAQLTEQEVRTLRGVLRSLQTHKPKSD